MIIYNDESARNEQLDDQLMEAIRNAASAIQAVLVSHGQRAARVEFTVDEDSINIVDCLSVYVIEREP